MFIMGIPIPITWCLFSEQRPRVSGELCRLMALKSIDEESAYLMIIKLWCHLCIGTAPEGSTHSGRDKMAFSNALFWMKIFKLWLIFYWSLFPRAQLTICQHWFSQWFGAKQATSQYLNQWWPMLQMHICITWPQWVISLRLRCNFL